ncbi:MAG: hypothetical protein RL115_671, partial [Bacteroidota bacterium]
MNFPTVSVVINWRNEVNANNCYSVYLRMTLNRVSSYYKIPLPQKVKLNQWSNKDGAWVKNTHPFSFEINHKIAEKRTAVIDLIKRSYTYNKPLSLQQILNHIKPKAGRRLFTDFFQNYIHRPPVPLKGNTIKKYNTCLS